MSPFKCTSIKCPKCKKIKYVISYACSTAIIRFLIYDSIKVISVDYNISSIEKTGFPIGKIYKKGRIYVR
jgi:hypothetical protein